MKDSWKSRVGILVVTVSILFGYGFGEIVVSLWTNDLGDQISWSFIAAVLFNIVVFTIIHEIENRKKPKDTV